MAGAREARTAANRYTPGSPTHDRRSLMLSGSARHVINALPRLHVPALRLPIPAGRSPHNFAGRADSTCADCNTHVAGPRDPFTDGAKTGKFDVFTDGEKVTDSRDPFTDGSHA